MSRRLPRDPDITPLFWQALTRKSQMRPEPRKTNARIMTTIPPTIKTAHRKGNKLASMSMVPMSTETAFQGCQSAQSDCGSVAKRRRDCVRVV
jgi:hypothetical protein